MSHLRCYAWIAVLLAACVPCARGFAKNPRQVFAPIPAEIRSEHFIISIGAERSPVVHAASGYYLLNFDLSGSAQVSVTASDPHYWDAGVEVQPMRLGIRPLRHGATISFPLDGPAKLSITRPGEHFADSEMLFLFANSPEAAPLPSTPGLRYYGPGVHHENIDVHDGDSIYLAPGAVVLGALNLWQVHHVHVFGRGIILYDGPQDPDHDTGWMHKVNWHAIVMDNASQIEIEGITAIVRSRTWMIQMRDSRDVTFRNVKVIGGSPGNANQDGMDWLGGGNTLIDDCFIRAADDIFAMYGNWDGYTEEALTTPGHEVSQITIERSVLSTSISNVIRANWPKKIFDSHNITLRDSDVIHMGQGSCGVPFALLEIWADPGGRGEQAHYRLEDIRMEDWYSLLQLRQPGAAVHDIRLTNISALDSPALATSALQGDVKDVSLGAIDLGGGAVTGNAGVPLLVLPGAEQPTYNLSGPALAFTYSEGLHKPNDEIIFTASAAKGLSYRWLFGDGSTAEGSTVVHRFADADGTLLDGSGRFRVLLAARDPEGHMHWSAQPVVVAATKHPEQPLEGAALLPGLVHHVDVVQGDQTEKIDQRDEGLLKVPADGGYTLTLLTSTTASLSVDGVRMVGRPLRAQVCGSKGSAVQAIRLSLALVAGAHSIQIIRGPELENAEASDRPSAQPILMWEGPGLLRQRVPDWALLHPAQASGLPAQEH